MAGLIEVTGVDVVQRRLQEISALVLPISAIDLTQTADAILERSKQLVPIDTQSLHDSGVVEQAQLTATTAAVTVRYGGTVGYQGRIPAEYAQLVEFDVTMPHPHGGQAHFLTQAVLEEAQSIPARLAEAIRVAL